jgi:hypothetical protein
MGYILNDRAGSSYEIKNGTLLSYSGTAKSVVVPSDVTSVGIDAFRNAGIESIELPYSVSKIYAGAFSDCSKLKKLIIPYTVTIISPDSFSGSNPVVYCYYGSYAYIFAVANSMNYELITAVFGAEKVKMSKGDKVPADARPSVELASGLPMVLSSDNESVAVVDGKGNIQAVAPGSAHINAYNVLGDLLGSMSVYVYDVNPSAEITNAQKSIDVPYGATLILHSKADVPQGCKAVWLNEKDEIIGEGETLELASADESFKVYAAVVDTETGDIITKSEAETVNVKSSFFNKIIAFFRRLFRIQKIIEQ